MLVFLSFLKVYSINLNCFFMTFKEKLLDLNKRGLIHAPDESDEGFFKRCRTASFAGSSPPSRLAKSLYDIDPDWVYMIYDNKGLHFWEGACTWKKQDHITLQLNKAFECKESYLGYSKEEVIAHELVHVVRGHFEEPVFEEILAYQSSPSPLRRLCAPLFRSPKESAFFVISLVVFFIAVLFETFQKVALAGFLGMFSLGFYRLFWAQWTFNRTRKKIAKIVGKEKVLAVMLRLTDREIIRFSKMPEEAILNYAKKMAKIHLRWQQIAGSYFSF